MRCRSRKEESFIYIGKENDYKLQRGNGRERGNRRKGEQGRKGGKGRKEERIDERIKDSSKGRMWVRREEE